MGRGVAYLQGPVFVRTELLWTTFLEAIQSVRITLGAQDKKYVQLIFTSGNASQMALGLNFLPVVGPEVQMAEMERVVELRRAQGFVRTV